MNSNLIKQLSKKIAQFEKLAQTVSTDQFFKTPLKPMFNWSFFDSAHALFSLLDPALQDIGASQGPVYQLMNIMGANTLPDATNFINLVQEVAALTDTLNNNDAKKLAAYLIGYAQTLVEKYLNAKEETDQYKENTSTTQSPATLLSKVYIQLRKGQPLNIEDQQKIQLAKAFYQRRLNGINGLANRTPTQEQERNIIQFVLDKV